MQLNTIYTAAIVREFRLWSEPSFIHEKFIVREIIFVEVFPQNFFQELCNCASAHILFLADFLHIIF